MEIFYITHAFSAYALSGILIASFCLFIGITLVAKKRPLLISSRFFCAAIALAILPDFIGNSIIMGPSEPGGFPFMTWANWFMFICVLAVFWIQAKGYLLIGIHDESFRKALHFSLNKSNIRFEERLSKGSLSVVALTEEEAELHVNILSWARWGQLKLNKSKDTQLLKKIISGINDYNSSNKIKPSNIIAKSYIVMGVWMIVIATAFLVFCATLSEI